MAISSPQVREVRGWKEQACAHCGCGYRMLLRESIDETSAETDVLRTMSRCVLDAPCPACGCYQPDLIALRRGRWHLGVLFFAAVAYSSLLTLVEIGLVSIIAGQYSLAAIGLAALLLQGWIAWKDPNRNREAGIATATRLLGDGSLKLLPGEPSPSLDRSGRLRFSRLDWLMLVLILLAISFSALAEGVRFAQGWPINEGWDPLVVGAGDSPRVTFAQTISSVKGCWKATAKAHIANAKELGLATDTIQVETQSATWSRTIQARTSQKDVREQLWVRVHLPRTLNCDGKRLVLKVAMWVCYPSASGPNLKRFTDQFRAFDLHAELLLAEPGAGRIYQLAWRVGSAFGGAMILLGGGYFLLRTRSLRRLARPGAVHLLPTDRTSDQTQQGDPLA